MLVALLLRLLTDDFGGMCVAIHGEQGDESRNLGEGEGGQFLVACQVQGSTQNLSGEMEGETWEGISHICTE